MTHILHTSTVHQTASLADEGNSQGGHYPGKPLKTLENPGISFAPWRTLEK